MISQNRWFHIFTVRVLPVQVCYGDDLAADVIVESVDAVSVNEAIADPASRPHCLRNVTQYLPSTFNYYYNYNNNY